MKRNSTNIGFIGFGRVVEWQINQMKGLNISIKFVFDICDNKLNTAREIIPEAKLYNNIEEVFNNISVPVCIAFAELWILLSASFNSSCRFFHNNCMTSLYFSGDNVLADFNSFGGLK